MITKFLHILIAMHITISHHSICTSNDPPLVIKISQEKITQNHKYTFHIQNYQAPVTITRNINGTFFHGNFSQISFFVDKQHYRYVSKSFSFKYPAQNRLIQASNQIVQMQVVYLLSDERNRVWKHKSLGLSVNFMVAEYAPQDRLFLSKSINQDLKNGSLINMKKLMPIISKLSMNIYKGIHSDYPQDDNFLWFIRKQLFLISEEQFYELKSYIFSHRSRETMQHHGLLTKMSPLHQINEQIIIEIP